MKHCRLPASGPMTQRDRSQVGFCLPRAYSPWPLGYSPLAFLSSFFYIWLLQVLLAAHGIFSCKLLVAACGIWFSDQGSNLVPLHWECGLLATGPPGKSPHSILLGPRSSSSLHFFFPLSVFSLPSCGTHSPVKYGEALPAVESQMLTGNSATSATNEAAGGQTARL